MNALNFAYSMTLATLGPCPARQVDGLAMPGALGRVARAGLEFVQRGAAEIGSGMTIQPVPQVLDRMAVQRVRWQKLVR